MDRTKSFISSLRHLNRLGVKQGLALFVIFFALGADASPLETCINWLKPRPPRFTVLSAPGQPLKVEAASDNPQDHEYAKALDGLAPSAFEEKLEIHEFERRKRWLGGFGVLVKAKVNGVPVVIDEVSRSAVSDKEFFVTTVTGLWRHRPLLAHPTSLAFELTYLRDSLKVIAKSRAADSIRGALRSLMAAQEALDQYEQHRRPVQLGRAYVWYMDSKFRLTQELEKLTPRQHQYRLVELKMSLHKFLSSEKSYWIRMTLNLSLQPTSKLEEYIDLIAAPFAELPIDPGFANRPWSIDLNSQEKAANRFFYQLLLNEPGRLIFFRPPD